MMTRIADLHNWRDIGTLETDFLTSERAKRPGVYRFTPATGPRADSALIEKAQADYANPPRYSAKKPVSPLAKRYQDAYARLGVVSLTMTLSECETEIARLDQADIARLAAERQALINAGKIALASKHPAIIAHSLFAELHAAYIKIDAADCKKHYWRTPKTQEELNADPCVILDYWITYAGKSARYLQFCADAKQIYADLGVPLIGQKAGYARGKEQWQTVPNLGKMGKNATRVEQV
jgi:hypothetical protein